MFIDMAVVHIVQVPVVKVVDVIVMVHCDMAAAGTMLMLMFEVVWLGAWRHFSGSFRFGPNDPRPCGQSMAACWRWSVWSQLGEERIVLTLNQANEY